MRHIFKFIAKFFFGFLVTTIVCTAVWQDVVNERLYDCTDAFGFDYWQPGNWVHSSEGHPVAIVHVIVHHRSMSEPDTIKEGWSNTRLWHLWYSFVIFSLVGSIVFALVPWIFIPRSKALEPDGPDKKRLLSPLPGLGSFWGQ